MTASVNPSTNFGIAKRREDLRLQLMATEMSARIGRRIKERRKELKLIQRELAALIGPPVNDQRISDWERGVNEPSDRYKKKLVEALQLDDLGGVGFFYAEPESPDLMGSFTAPASSASLQERLAALQETAGLILAELERLSLEGDARQARARNAGARKGTRQPGRKARAA